MVLMSRCTVVAVESAWCDGVGVNCNIGVVMVYMHSDGGGVGIVCCQGTVNTM